MGLCVRSLTPCRVTYIVSRVIVVPSQESKLRGDFKLLVSHSWGTSAIDKEKGPGQIRSRSDLVSLSMLPPW